jgi:hypothetical protein
MLSKSQCKGCSYNIQGKNFTTDFRAISLKWYDLIMGTDWMQVHNLVEFDYRSHNKGLAIEYYGQEKVMFKDTTTQQNQVVPIGKLHKIMEKCIVGGVVLLNLISPVDSTTLELIEGSAVSEILQEFSGIFEEPKELPPKRECDHAIPLHPDAKPVNIRP